MWKEYVDLSGKIFGNWTVIKRMDGNDRRVRYLCKCKCGTERKVVASLLNNGQSKSCGCRPKILPKISDVDLVGKRFGSLVVIEIIRIGGHKSRQIVCKCDCGNIESTTHSVLEHKYKVRCIKCTKIFKPNFKGYGKIGLRWWTQHILRRKEKHGMEINISIKYAWDLLVKQNFKCALTGVDIQFPNSRKDKLANASIDRIENSKGYIVGNIQWVDMTINMIKGKLNNDEFINICRLINNYTYNFAVEEMKQLPKYYTNNHDHKTHPPALQAKLSVV